MVHVGVRHTRLAADPTRLASRYEDPDFALAFARLVTHYVRHDDFLEDGILLRDAHLLADIPGVLVNGRFDLQAPVANAWELDRAWPQAELVIVDDAGHAADEPGAHAGADPRRRSMGGSRRMVIQTIGDSSLRPSRSRSVPSRSSPWS